MHFADVDIKNTLAKLETVIGEEMNEQGIETTGATSISLCIDVDGKAMSKAKLVAAYSRYRNRQDGMGTG